MIQLSSTIYLEEKQMIIQKMGSPTDRIQGSVI